MIVTPTKTGRFALQGIKVEFFTEGQDVDLPRDQALDLVAAGWAEFKREAPAKAAPIVEKEPDVTVYAEPAQEAKPRGRPPKNRG